jgi:hypothetical protein
VVKVLLIGKASGADLTPAVGKAKRLLGHDKTVWALVVKGAIPKNTMSVNNTGKSFLIINKN